MGGCDSFSLVRVFLPALYLSVLVYSSEDAAQQSI